MAKKKIQDLTEGTPSKLILSFSLPILFGLLFQQMYSLVDTAIVGRTLGSNALGAVGSTGALHFLILGFCTGLCSGFSVPIAQSVGARQEQDVRRYIYNAIYLTAGISLLFAVVTGLCSRQFLIWMNTPANFLDMAHAYIGTIFWGTPTILMYNVFSGILRALGDSRTPVYYLIIASLLNIVLDLLFIMQFQMGVFGAALATVLSQLVSGTGCVISLSRRFTVLHCAKEERKWRTPYAKRLMAIGAPMGLQFSITAVGSVIIQTAVNGLGEIAVTSVTAANKVHGVIACVFDALGSTMATYCGQNRGAGKPDRIRKGVRYSVITAMVYAAAAHVAVFFFGRVMISLFVTGESVTEIIELAQQYLFVMTIFYPALILIYLLRNAVQGMGFTKEAMYAGVFELFGRISIAFALVPVFGFDAACYAAPFAWVLAGGYLAYCYVRSVRKIEERVRQRTGMPELS